MSLLYLDSEVLQKIVQELDAASASSLAYTCSRLANLCVSIRGSDSFSSRYQRPSSTLQMVTGSASNSIPTVTFSASTASSPGASEDESRGSTDTDMTSSPEEEEWEFELTSDIIKRLSALPSRNHGATLSTLPTELQLEIFGYLDKIDSCCLGLASPNLYVVFRAIHGTKMSLSTRRIGPNSLESAWEVVGKQECKQCGVYRCELHQHIKSWMPKELEYCAMKQNFGLPARNSPHASCYRGKPSKPRRCGRHPLRTTSVHQDDPSYSIPSVAR